MDDLTIGTSGFETGYRAVRFSKEPVNFVTSQDLDALLESTAVANGDIHLGVGNHVVHARNAVGRLGIQATEFETKTPQPFEALRQALREERS